MQEIRNTLCKSAFLPLSVFLCALCALCVSNAQEFISRPADELRKLPIVVGDGDIVKLLKTWWQEGTAAGNVGDWYDNRDGDHSPLDIQRWPQLQKIHYTEQMVKDRVNWGGQGKALPIVVFGNSSTSAPATQEGSNPRQFYTRAAGLHILDQQYAKNNLYIYPEHRDHDPGRNGRGPGGEEGYGDLYPTNTPYLIISQGSSGTDEPFMRAIPYVLAAFRPEVKAKLAENGLLMPTVQMIFRSSNKHLKSSGDYLTAKAHPSVFEGSSVDALKMATMAHDITLDSLPPEVRLKVVDEDRARPAADYFDPTNGEALGDTSAVIARIFRGKDLWRKMTVSAESSRDLNGKPLKFEWKLFRGDPQGVKITPKNAAGSVVEIEVAHPKRRPIAPGSPLESSRVDIGVFAHNGRHWSAPGFITWYGIEHESRTYDDKGRIAEIAYGSGELRIAVKDWWKLLSKANEKWFPPLTKDQSEIVATLEKERIRILERIALSAVDPPAHAAKLQEFDDKQQSRFVDAFAKSHLARLDQLTKTDLVDNPDYKTREAQASAAQKNAVKIVADELKSLDLKTDALGKDRSLVKGPTAFDRELMSWLNAERLSQIVFPESLRVQRLVNYVDVRVSLPRVWRDVFLYGASGEYTGWMRMQPGLKEPAFFTPDGLLVVERDELGRCHKARNVVYSFATQAGAADRFHLRWLPGTDEVEYEYRSPEDRHGKTGKVRKLPSP